MKMRVSLVILSLFHFLGAMGVAEEEAVRPAPPGYAYPVLPARYEGKRLSDLGPIKSIELIDRKLPAADKPSPVTNETIRKLVFEHRLAHPSSFAMLDSSYSKIIVVTFEDGTRFHCGRTILQTIEHPDKSGVGCMLLPDSNYRNGRMALAVKPAGAGDSSSKPAARSDQGSDGKSQTDSEKRPR